MSRTDAHTRYKHLPDGREYFDAYKRFFYGGRIYGPEYWAWRSLDWNPEWNKHYSRSSAEGWYAHQENRRERHHAKAALRRGDYDSIPLHMTGRHTAAWLAS